jgi:hypothetical protein
MSTWSLKTAPSQTIACKNNETFHIFGHFKVRQPPSPMINVGKSGLNFLFSVIRTTLNWGWGGIYVVVSIIFAPDWIACKNNETLHVFGHFKVRWPPPGPMINVGKSGLNFLFSVIHTTLNWGWGGIYAVVSIIFATDCLYSARVSRFAM